jgi:NO-binding membrane sensor protein with MHYT domain/DNA-binding LytR/AlgR family response regulator
MPVTHEPWLVALSLFLAIQGSYVGLSLAVQVGAATGLRRRLLIAGAAISLAFAIWTMHFIGMLAARLPFPVDYLVFPTLLSFLICVIVVGAAVFAANAGPLTPVRLAAAAVFMGLGIVSMHYTGMTALHASAHMMHATQFVAGSVAVAIAASGLALWLANSSGGRPPLLFSATALGIAIAGMHYTAMTGVTIFPHVTPASGAPALSSDLLAIVVAIVAFLVSGIFLLALVPDRAGQQAAAAPDNAAARSQPHIQRGAAQPAAPNPPSHALKSGNGADLGWGGYGPLGGAGAPPRRLARHLPIERDGATHYVAVDDIVAIHANAHYTHIFDGRDQLFCPLAIGEVESRLDTGRFARVHRSHIVNLDRVVGLRRAGDSGAVELPDRSTVPVSRSRLGWLKARLNRSIGEAVS